ncbi:flagellar brake protein [Neptunomonas antarctica]|uniref:Protein YcgR n=1 Tax=Neptunomonas antarctica TaxID=619304 RepID=A0A1N7KLM3_9GAMM|nr:PilZ domain-containing protein [Neptunomonas antarctica]SIS62468.1 protein YcgR [Neptunomonas antarctica]
MIPTISARQNVKTLKELMPTVGEFISIQFQVPRKRFKLKLLGFQENGGVIVSAPKGNVNTLNLEGARLTATLMAGNRRCAFVSRLLKAHPSPYPHWHLAYPETVEYQSIRKHQRIPVNLAVSVDHQDEIKSANLGMPRIVHCLNISLNGVSVDAPSALGQIGDQYFLTLRFQVGGLDQVILLPAILRNIENIEPDVMLHGMEFDALEEDTRLLITAFFYQQYLTELGYLDDE